MVVDSGNNLDYSFWQCALCMLSIDADQKRESVFLVCPYKAIQDLLKVLQSGDQKLLNV